jgi:catechol 2,3-dioxygenase-like lactoylglutathione lyase family enzyme
MPARQICSLPERLSIRGPIRVLRELGATGMKIEVTMLSTSPLVGFLATKAPHRARQFYEDVLGLRLVADEPFALVFDANGTMLRFQKVEQTVTLPYTALGWQVDDIAGTVRELSAKGVAFERYASMEQDEVGVWTSPGGARVAWFKDPDANLLSLTQF